jgi:hypothetical protein
MTAQLSMGAEAGIRISVAPKIFIRNTPFLNVFLFNQYIIT